MILVIDAGNSALKLAYYRGEELLGLVGSPHDVRKNGETGFEHILDCTPELTPVDGVIISSVVPRITDSLCSLVERKFQIVPIVVSAKLNLGLTVAVDFPDKAGSDRLANVVAAVAKYGAGPVIAIDMGTATTFSVVDSKNRYIGGSIHPGFGVSWDAFHSRASHLPRVKIENHPPVIGKNTEDALKSAAFYGAVSLIDGMVQRIWNELGVERCPVVLTGGNAVVIKDASAFVTDYDGRLTLDGIRIIYERNAPRL